MRLSIALALTIMTGFSGLVYEVTWQKYLAILLGSHSEATATVLAVFLGGLSIGYALFGRMTRLLVARARETGRPLRLLRTYAAIEAGIGIYAALFPSLFAIAQRVSLMVPSDYAGIGFGFDVLLTAVLIGPAAVLMGGTIPILTLALTRDLEDATRIHAWVYGFNTLGAFAGALCGGFLLIPMIGLDGVLGYMAAVNLVAAAGFAYLDYRGQRGSAADREVIIEVESSAVIPNRIEGYWGLIAVSTLAGFAMMSIQTILIRVGSLALGASTFTFAMVVAVFVLAIALGSLAVSAFERIPAGVIAGSQWLLFGLLVLLYRYIPDSPYYAHAARAFFRDQSASFYPHQLLLFAALLAILIIPIGLSGALLPLLFHHLRRTLGDLGSIAGRLYSWNTVGSLLGALLGGYVLLIWLDLHHVYRIALAAIGIGAGILTAQLLRLPQHWTAITVILPVLASLMLLDPWDPERLVAGLFRIRAPKATTYAGVEQYFEKRKSLIIFHEDGPSVTVTVREDESKDDRLRRSIATNGKPDGHLVGDYPTMALAGLVPALLAESAERSFVIGFGTGVTAGELGALDGMREVHVAEISRAVIHAAPLFEEGNRAPLRNPKVEIRRGDAIRSLRRSTGTYDVIVSEPSNPWVTGVEMLYSREFLEAGRDRLSKGGVYTQWFHQYEINDEAIALILRTFASVFPHVSLWFTTGPDLLIMGFKDVSRVPSLAALQARFRQPDFAAGFDRVGIRRFPALLAHELVPVGVIHSAGIPGELHTLLHPRLSHEAARGFFVGENAPLPKFLLPKSVEVGSRNSLLRRLAGNGELPEGILGPAAREACRLNRHEVCATMMALWQLRFPLSTRRETVLAQARKPPAQALELTEPKLSNLIRLFEPDPGFKRRARPLTKTRKLTTMYVDYFHHPAPFERGALRKLWRECDTSRCDQVRGNVEKIVGPIDLRPGRRSTNP
jgi:spermidine synthase